MKLHGEVTAQILEGLSWMKISNKNLSLQMEEKTQTRYLPSLVQQVIMNKTSTCCCTRISSLTLARSFPSACLSF